VYTFDGDEVYRKVVALVESFPTVVGTAPVSKEIGAIPDF
jgi:hypothetical protein